MLANSDRTLFSFRMASEKKTCTCAECGKSFVNTSNLTRHMRQFHRQDQMLHCVYATCRKSFERPAELAHHLISHQGERMGEEVSAVFSPGPASEGSPSPAAPQRESPAQLQVSRTKPPVIAAPAPAPAVVVAAVRTKRAPKTLQSLRPFWMLKRNLTGRKRLLRETPVQIR